MAEKQKKASTFAVYAEKLRGRSRMAVATIGGVFLIGFFGASKPLTDRIDDAELRIIKAQTRKQLATEVADLRRLAAIYQKKLPRGIDLNEWTQYLLTGINSQRVRLIRMDPRDQLSLGPCKVVTWNIELEGDFQSLSSVIEWMENRSRLVRLDRILFEGKHGRLTLAMVVRGLALDVPQPKDTFKDHDRNQDKTPKPGGAGHGAAAVATAGGDK